MKDVIFDEFQNKVDEVLIRHANLLDILSKIDEVSSKTNRAVVKTITQCGCVKLSCTHDVKETPIEDESRNHISGELCPICRDKIEEEMGKLHFYLNALCNALDINSYDVLLKEYKKISTLGKFSLY